MPTSIIAFFGATGGCAGFCLANALNAGYTCTALARTPAKLTSSLEAKGVRSETLDTLLTIVEGNVKDIEAVKRTLQTRGRVVDTIVSGIGSTDIVMQWSIITPLGLKDPKICQDAGATILRALQELKPVTKPLFINVSTTGIPSKGKPRDCPLAVWPFYVWLLHVMHVDKRVLQENLAAHVHLPEAQRGISGHVIVKASLLMDGEGKGLKLVREGSEDKPAVGYTIQRKDVGAWIFERLIEGEVRSDWMNKAVCITY